MRRFIALSLAFVLWMTCSAWCSMDSYAEDSGYSTEAGDNSDGYGEDEKTEEDTETESTGNIDNTGGTGQSDTLPDGRGTTATGEVSTDGNDEGSEKAGNGSAELTEKPADESSQETSDANGLALYSGDTANAYSGSEDAVPKHSKYVESNGDGTYKLTLEVQGMSETETEVKPSDIIVVLDISGSMIYGVGKETNVPEYNLDLPHDGYGGILDSLVGSESRIQVARDALGKMAHTVLDNDYGNRICLIGFDNRAVVRYSGGNEANTDVTQRYGWGTSSEDFVEAIPTFDSLFYWYTAHMGTNWQNGVQFAQEQFKSVRSGDETEKYIIFITDGEPTDRMRYDNDIYGELGPSLGTEELNAIEGARLASKSALELKNYIAQCGETENTHIYCIGLGELVDGSLTRTWFEGVFGNAALEADTVWINSTEGLTEKLANITNEIQKACYNVTITDTLSIYAEIDGNFTYTTKMVKDGVTSDIPSEAGVKVTYDKYSKTVTMDFADDYTLDPEATYYVSFDIKPSQKAYDDYAENKTYPHTGETGTGTDSAGKEGFYSNNTAVLSYSFGEEKDKSVDFNKPVIQTELVDIPVQKVWGREGTRAIPESIDVWLLLDYEDYQAITLTEENGWKGTFTDIPPGHKYAIMEDVPDGFEAEYAPEDLELGSYATEDLDILKKGVTITNNDMYFDSLTISKQVTGNTGDRDKEFEIEIELVLRLARSIDHIDNDILNFSVECSDGTVLTFVNGKATIKLKSGESLTLKGFPDLSEYSECYEDVIIRETASSSNGYEVTYNGEQTDSYHASSGETVEIVNHKESIPMTNVGNTGKMELLLLLAAGCALTLGACIGISRRYRHR